MPSAHGCRGGYALAGVATVSLFVLMALSMTSAGGPDEPPAGVVFPVAGTPRPAAVIPTTPTPIPTVSGVRTTPPTGRSTTAPETGHAPGIRHPPPSTVATLTPRRPAHRSSSNFELPWQVTDQETRGLFAVAGEATGAMQGRTSTVQVAGPGTRHCTKVGGQFDGASDRVTVSAWGGHAKVLGCTLQPVTVRFVSPPGEGKGDGATVNHLVLSVSPESAESTGIPPRCVVDFVAGISTAANEGACKPVAASDSPVHAESERFASLRWAPRHGQPSNKSPQRTVFLDFVSIEVTRFSAVLPFVPPLADVLVDTPKFSLAAQAPSAPISSGPPAELRARLDAPMRCDQGLYMGFTNIIESLVACVVFAVAGRRNHVEFPSRFQQESFLTLFDAERLRSKALEWYGVHVSFLDRGQSVLTPKEFHSVLPKLAKDFPAFRRVTGARPGARVFTGDVWVTRLTSISESHQTRWFKGAAYVPAGKLRVMSERLIDEIRSLSVKAGAASRSAAQKGISNSGGQWAAVHLRLESDRAGHGSEAAKAGVGTLNKIKQQLAQHFNNNPNVPALYASGALEENIKREIPASWRNKNDYFDAANWAGMWRGTWFDGRAYDITNATGSLVDMFVLLEAPLTIMAEFSSFGEYVAALRCAWERPTIMYGTSGDFFKVDCSKQLLFMRAWHTENRKLGCPGATVSTHACANHFKGHQAFKMNVLKLDGAIRDYSESMLQTVPR